MICRACRNDLRVPEGLLAENRELKQQIVELRAGELVCELSTGRQVTRAIADVDYLQITDWPLFNVAEKQQRDGNLRRALTSYEQVLADMQRDPATRMNDGLDRHLLTQCRLLRTADASGRFDRAVSLYLTVIEKMPEVLETLRPQRMPAPGSSFWETSRKQIEQAIERHGNDDTARSLRAWLKAWPDQGGDGQGSEPQPSTQPAESGDNRRAITESLGEIERL